MLFFSRLSRVPDKYKNNSKLNNGFTLVELLLTLAISSIIVLSLNSILNFTVKCCRLGKIEDEILLNGRYAIEYIKRDIRTADKIFCSSKIEQLNEKHENNIGFVTYHYYPNDNDHNYATYILSNKRIYRISVNLKNDKLPKGNSFSGYNTIANHILSTEETSLDIESKMIELSFILQNGSGEEVNYNIKIGVRCPIVY